MEDPNKQRVDEVLKTFKIRDIDLEVERDYYREVMRRSALEESHEDAPTAASGGEPQVQNIRGLIARRTA